MWIIKKYLHASLSYSAIGLSADIGFFLAKRDYVTFG